MAGAMNSRELGLASAPAIPQAVIPLLAGIGKRVLFYYEPRRRNTSRYDQEHESCRQHDVAHRSLRLIGRGSVGSRDD